jgi:ERCC4-type nuclease
VPSSILVAPSEPTLLKGLGKSSAVPEKHGVDIMFANQHGTFGVQRKELSDFFASVTDGRLAREFPLMTQLGVAVLLIEGRQRWSTEGYLLNLAGAGGRVQRKTWTRDQFRSYMLSVQQRGVWVVETDDLNDTIAWVKNFERWASKDSHHSLIARPKPAGAWGTPDSHDWALHLMQSFDGIGPVQAERILETFDGQIPLAWTCTKVELGSVKGIGKQRLDKLWNALPTATSEEPAA